MPDMPLDPGQDSLPASVTMELTHRFARFLTGAPLQVVLTLRNVVWEFVLFALMGPDDLGPPQYLILQDRATGKRLARIKLGREAGYAETQREIVGRDLEQLTAAEFMAEYVPSRLRP